MSTIEDRIVSLKFDNRQFEQGVKQTQKSLLGLNKSLKMEGASKGMGDLSRSMSRFSLGGIGSAVEGVSNKFSALKVAGVTALATITNQAVTAGQRLVKSLTLDPIMDGFREYETNMNSVQTILANTAHQGTNLKQVNAALDELNTYSDKTIYNFSEMARNIGTFTAAGVDLDTSTSAIKGIANLAAVSGSNSQQASTAMYQLSQALAAGKVSLMDWNSVVNAGMGGKVFQDSLMETARKHGIAIDDMVKKEGGFRNTLQNGWLSSEILTETLNKFTGDMTESQLKQMGYTDEQIKGILKMGKTAQDAATKIKTMSQLVGSLQEAAGSGWAKTWQILFGDFEEAKALFTSINDVLSEVIGSSADSRNKLLSDWKDLGGRQALIDGLSNAFKALVGFITPVSEALRDIFPPITAKQLLAMTVAFKEFTEGLKMGADTTAKVKSVFRGIFAVLDIGRMIVVGAVKMFLNLFGVLGEGSGGILTASASFGEFLVSIRNTLKSTGAITKFFETLGSILALPIRLIKDFGTALFGSMGGLDFSGVIDNFKNLDGALDPVVEGLRRFADQFSFVGDLFDGVGGFIGDSIRVMTEAVSEGMKEFFGAFKGSANSDTIFAALNTALAGGAFVMVRKFINKILEWKSPVEGIADAITGAVSAVTDSFSVMQNTLKAATLLQIGAAIALVAGSIAVLAKLDAGDIKKAMLAISGIFAQLGAALFGLTFLTNGKLALQLPLVATGLILLAAAVRIMAESVEEFSGMSWDEIARGLAGLAGTLLLLVGATKLLGGAGPRLAATAAGLAILGVAIKILASAVEDMGDLKWSELARGLIGVGTVLGALALFTKFSAANKGAVAQGAGLLLLGAAIKVLASAVGDFADMELSGIVKGLLGLGAIFTMLAAFAKVTNGGTTLLGTGAALVLISGSIKIFASAISDLGSMNMGSLVKGLLGMGAALAIVGTALMLIPPNTLVTAAALVGVSVALNLIAGAMKLMATMSWGDIAKSLVAMAGALTILGTALYFMTGTLPGAAALIVAAGALALLVPPLIAMSTLTWGEIAKGLVALAGALAIIAAAGYLLIGAVPGLLGLGAAALLLGTAALVGGTGVLAFAKALQILGGMGKSAIKGIIDVIVEIIKFIPSFAVAIAKGFVRFIEVIGEHAPKVSAAFLKIMGSILDTIVRLTPKILDTFGKLVMAMLNYLRRYAPQYASAAAELMIAILNAIAKKLPQMITAATNVAVAFMNGLAANTGRISDAGAKLVIAVVNGMANAIRKNKPAMRSAGLNLGSAIVEGMGQGMSNGVSFVTSMARYVAGQALQAAKRTLGIASPSKEFKKLGVFTSQGFALGLKGGYPQIKSTLEQMFKLTSGASKAAAANERKALATYQKARRTRGKGDIARALRAYNAAKTEHIKANAVHNLLLKNMNKQRSTLQSLGRQYDSYTAKIQTANKAYADAVKTRDDYTKQVSDQYGAMPSIGAETTYDSYKQDLEKQISDTLTFNRQIQELRKRGLSDEMYKQLLTQGTAALPFMQGIIDRGKAGIKEINALSKKLESEAIGLGVNASRELYQAAVDSAKGLVVGLEKQRAAIAKQMDIIADSMVSAIKKKLGIKSPSREFMTIGKFVDEGLVAGLEAYSSNVSNASAQVGMDAINAMRKTIADVGSIALSDISAEPVITPVLDLTAVKEEAANISNLLGMQTLAVDASTASALVAANGVESNRLASAEMTGAVINDNVTFNQNNYSPKALSPIEIYRQTNNQLSVAKGALTK